MADEITAVVQLNVANVDLLRTFNRSGTDDQTSAFVAHVTRQLSTTNEAISDADITTLGWVAIFNLDKVDKVMWGNGSGDTPFEVPPLGVTLFHASGESLWAKASVGTVEAEFFLVAE